MALDAEKLIRIEEVFLGLDEDEGLLLLEISRILGLAQEEIIDFTIVRKNIDSRQRKIRFVYSLDVRVKDAEKISQWETRHRVRLHEPYVYQEKKAGRKARKHIVVVGTGPCGLFAALLLARAGLAPLVIERGKDVDARIKDVERFRSSGVLDPESNVQFGEGGAGTFSDGKLYTLINDPRSAYVFSELIKAGAPAEIAWSGTPHIGTDRLRQVVKNIRQEIIRLDGHVRFGACLTDIEIKNNKLQAIIINQSERIETSELILATGHSARDTYQLLYERQLALRAKAFAIGLRIEHLAEAINKAQYSINYLHPKLGAAKYKLVQHLPNNRSVFTFCMCPGGYVMAAASEAGGVVVNGMSEYAQDNVNSNSALLVPVTPADFPSAHPLAGVEFQRRWECQAFAAGGSDYSAPCQLVGDFLKRKTSRCFGSVQPSYQPGVRMADLGACLPAYVGESIRSALPLLDKKLKGFAHPDAVLIGVETRSSAPVCIERDKGYETNVSSIFPAGEGAGQAGGIMSSAIDGMRVAEAIIEKYT